MAKTPNPRSYEQILGDMLSTFTSKIGVNDLNTGSAVTSFFETMAQAVYRASGDTFAILRDFSVDRAEGEALKRIAEEERVSPIPARVSTGRITITDTSFEKISTKVYSGTPSPNIGSVTINVSDASLYTPTGSVYVGRGTPNIEGPIPYSSITPVGGFFTLNLSSPTTKFHNVNETVILAQGGVRNIPSGVIVKAPAAGSSEDVRFITTRDSTILDGENVITSVPIAAQEPGTDGNVPRNSINKFESDPFTGATVTNPSPLTTGRNEETDEEIRNRIKKARISRGLGTAIAVESSVIGAQAPDENAVVTSDQIVSDGEETTLFIDDGQGYEEKTQGVGLEFIVDSALGGEQFFQLATGGSQTSVAKAFLEATNQSPYNVNPNDRLSLLVGGVLSEHVFNEGDFRSNGASTAFEIVASVNANPNVKFSARTIDNGTRVILEAKTEEEEFIQKTTPSSGDDAGIALGLPASEAETLILYKNKQKLSRNGRSASIETENQADWSPTIVTGDTLVIAVDGTASVVYTFINADFAAEGTHSTVAQSNTLQSWVNVINAKITGITASINGTRIVLASNLGANSRAKLEIDASSTLVSKGMFDSATLVSEGKESDFTLSRNTAQFKLTAPLQAGDSLTAGTEFTQGSVESTKILGGIVTLPTDAQLWFVLDNQEALVIDHGVTADSQIHFTKEAANIVRFRSVLTDAFASVQAGDYVTIWTEELSAVNRLEGRVNTVGTDTVSNDFFEMVVTASEYAAAFDESPVTFQEGLDFLRSDDAPQKIVIPAATYNINTIASLLNDDLIGARTFVENDEVLVIQTDNKSTDGSILIFAFNDPAKSLNFTSGDSNDSSFSHFAFFNNITTHVGFPLFIHSSMSADRISDPPTTLIPDFASALDLDVAGVDPNVMACMLHPYLVSGTFVQDAQAAGECVQIDDITGTLIDIDDSKTIRRLRTGDRYWLSTPYDFNFNDDITVVLDIDAANKTFTMPLYRRAITNTTMPINSDQFRAYDVDAGATTEFSDFFTASYDFKNYKALMRARNVIDPSAAIDEDAILYRAAVWGKAGEKYNVGYIYPTSPSQSIASTVTIDSAVNIRISLESGAAVTNTIDGTTEWDITITPNTPVAGVDEVTYTHSGTGTAPGMTTLAVGDYVTINSNGQFDPANIGTFRISSATSTSFTVRRPNGVAVGELGIATLTTNTISLYEDSATTAQEIVDYVTANLTSWIEAEVLDDNGSTGAGVIDKSTYEDNDFGAGLEGITLVDGINWIKSSDLGALTPNLQFEFKETLALASFSTNTTDAYAFNDGEEVRIIPTTTPQLLDFFAVLAVTGFTTLGEVSSSSRERNLQLATQILGSSGAVTISGGTGNIASAPVRGTSSLVPDTGLMKTSIDESAAAGLGVGQYVRIASANAQKKITGISFTTNATITPNAPTATESIVELANRDVFDRYFGQPRNHARDRGRAFHVEKHGSLVNISWDGITGSSPVFAKSVEFANDGGDMSVNFNTDSQSTEYIVQTGTRSFLEVQIGDSITLDNFTEAKNNGTFKVNGVSDDGLTISAINPVGVTEATKTVALGDIAITTEISENDTVEIGAPFAILNQGRFRVVRRYLDSIYIENDSAVEERVVIADNLRSLGFDATTEFDVTVAAGMKIEFNTTGTTPTLENAKMGDVMTVGTDFAAANQGEYLVVDSGSNFVILANANAVAETSVTVTGDVLEAQISSMVFSPYENTVAGDRFIISGDVLTEANQGTYTVTSVLSKTRIVVDDILAAQAAVQFNNLFVQVFVEEGVNFFGYKKIFSKAVDPANSTRACLLFDSQGESLKINEASGAIITSTGKLGYTEAVTKGFDSYRFHTGLIAQANKIVYGDPRDNITFPGVSAAGAEIFIKPPLVRKIQISISVRLKTGIPFARIVEQVRNNIAALVNSSPIGVSIAISDVVSTVNNIPGVTAVAIASPAYDVTNDVIVVNPAEKPFVLDIVNDITVSKVE